MTKQLAGAGRVPGSGTGTAAHPTMDGAAADALAEHALDRVSTQLRVALGRLNRKLRQQGTFDDLTRTQLNVLSRLEKDGPATGAELARAEGIRPQSMTAVIAALEAAGHVERRPDPSDGRKTLLSVSEATQRQYDSKTLARADWLSAAIASELDADEQRQLEASIALITKLANHA